MEKKGYFLIAQWNPSRGQTESNPGSIIGTGSYTERYPLRNVNREFCYKTRERAENYAARLYTRYSRTAVIEVPESALAPITVNATTIGNFLWETEQRLMLAYGCDAAEREIAPLKWYINTGRASTAFLKKLFAAKPFMVARKLHMGGSDEEIIKRIRKYIGEEG